MKKINKTLYYFLFVFLLFVIIFNFNFFIHSYPVWPPIVAIALALITKDVVISLFTGIFTGALISYKPDSLISFIKYAFISIFTSVDKYILDSVVDKDHAIIILFTLIIGGTVGVVTASGGLKDFVDVISSKVNSRIKTQISTWLLGIAIFFDDYSNCLIVGNMMRPLSDKFRISREKLSFIIDATAAPVSSLFLVSTWIGFELGLISDAMKSLGKDIDAYSIFINSIPYRFYVIIMLFFIPLTILLKREFGPMYEAEERAIKKNQVLRPGSKPLMGESFNSSDKKVNWEIAFIPIIVLIMGVIVGLVLTGINNLNGPKTLSNIISNANSFKALLWGAIISSITAVFLVVVNKIMTFKEAMEKWIEGIKSMLMAVIVLSLAWGIGLITKEIKTAEYVISLIGDKIPVWSLPAILFTVSAVISFATGTSWGTMAILFPVAIPLAYTVAGNNADIGYVYAVCGTILSGSVFGDHCSPISDTTILSSIGSSVDHVDHVRTQIVYAVFVAIVCVFVCYIPAGFGINPFLLNIIAILILMLFFIKFARKLPEE